MAAFTNASFFIGLLLLLLVVSMQISLMPAQTTTAEEEEEGPLGNSTDVTPEEDFENFEDPTETEAPAFEQIYDADESATDESEDQNNNGTEVGSGGRGSRAAFKTRHAMCSWGGMNRHTYTHCKRAKGVYYKWWTGKDSPCCKLTSAAKYRKFIASCVADDIDFLDDSTQMTWCKYYCADGTVCQKG